MANDWIFRLQYYIGIELIRQFFSKLHCLLIRFYKTEFNYHFLFFKYSAVYVRPSFSKYLKVIFIK